MKKILVIDDDRGVLGLLKSRLEKHGYQVATAIDAIDGLAQMLDNPPDLITLDIMMPGIRGVDKYGSSLCEFIKKSREHKEISVVIISIVKPGSDPVITEMVKDADAYFTKPFNTKDVIDKIDELLKAKNT